MRNTVAKAGRQVSSGASFPYLRGGKVREEGGRERVLEQVEWCYARTDWEVGFE